MNREDELFKIRRKTGVMLKQLRKEKGHSLDEAGRIVDISAGYLSEIEKAVKVPSDHLIRKLADFYNIPENDLFRGFGKVPLVAREILESNEYALKMILDIDKHKKYSEDEKHGLIEDVHRAYKAAIRIHEKKYGKDD